MIKEIFLSGEKIHYDLCYKNVKNINLRIKHDGTVHVSANKNVPQKLIDDFIVLKADFVLRAIEKYKNNATVSKKQYFADDEIRDVILKLCSEAYPYFKERDISFPKIRFRRMVSCWGSCNSQKGILTFSTNLIYAPEECVKYVVLHEFTHFLQPNHSKAFYSELKKVCPDWKECRNKLKNIIIH